MEDQTDWPEEEEVEESDEAGMRGRNRKGGAEGNEENKVRLGGGRGESRKEEVELDAKRKEGLNSRKEQLHINPCFLPNPNLQQHHIRRIKESRKQSQRISPNPHRRSRAFREEIRRG